MPKEEKLLTTKDLAHRWSMDAGSIENWRNGGKGPKYLKLGNAGSSVVRYRLSDVVAWEKKCVVVVKGKR